MVSAIDDRSQSLQTREVGLKRLQEKIPLGLFFCVCLAVLFYRGFGLGQWSLAVDEYYMAKASGQVLSHGFPEFDCGGYYFRGILQQYLTAPFLNFLDDPELAVRLVPFVANCATAPAVYLIAKRMGGSAAAAIATLFFSFSVIELEMARFARMYSPFQALFIWQVYFYWSHAENPVAVPTLHCCSLPSFQFLFTRGLYF